MTTFTVRRGDIVLSGSRSGVDDAPTVVLVHGYPDSSHLWSKVVPLLEDGLQVVTYDVRGAGASSTPARVADYDFDHLVADLGAVVDRVSPGRPVHLVGHDWGAIQGWEAVTAPALRGRIASFTAVSAPSFDHGGRWARGRVRPRPSSLRALGRQLSHSWYMGMFQAPVLPEVVLSRGGESIVRGIIARTDGVAPASDDFASTLAADARNGVNLYRANADRLLRPRRDRLRVEVPVQVVVGRHDGYVTLPLFDDLHRHADEAYLHVVEDGHHWLPRTHPEVVADAVREMVARSEDGAPSTRLGRHSLTGAAWQGRLVVVTGAANGIGRATALAAAERGATVVLSDVDLDASERAAVLCRHVGADARALRLDVADPNAWDKFVEEVLATYGVPDVVVNNAGIGMAGEFLDTTLEDWERILGVNLWGVVHGCRTFGRAMVDAGVRGHIVNLASMAAFGPGRGLSAYSVTKAAVLMLSGALRTELADHGIGVSAICPGVIDTGITDRTAFVGVDEAEQARRRSRTSALYRRRSLGPDAVAAAIVRAVDEDRPVAPVGVESHAGRVLSRLAPEAYRRLLSFDAVSQ